MSDVPPNKACVILGAGASADVWDTGAPKIDGDFQPPLANELFNIQQRPQFWRVMQRYRGARLLTQELAPRSVQDNFDLEATLRDFAHHPDGRIREAFKHVPLYLRDLLYMASTNYTSEPSCYVRLVVALMAQEPHEVLFLVLNYDTLLEQALELFEPGSYTFRDYEDYIDNSRQAKVVKLHGSVNWFREMGPGDTYLDQITQLDIFGRPKERQLRIVEIEVAENARYNDSLLYPVLTAPLAGKGSTDLVCPSAHSGYARQFLSTCHKFLIIGSSGLDSDLLSLLDSSIDTSAKTYARFVGMGSRATRETVDRFHTGVRAFRDSNTAHDSGFRTFIHEGGLSSFASV